MSPSDQGERATGAGGVERPSGATLAEGAGEGLKSPDVPPPGSLPKAPIDDLATIRLSERADTNGKPFVRARAYLAGVQISETNSSSAVAALAGASADIESALRGDGAGGMAK